MPESTRLLMLHLMDLQAQMEHQIQCLRRVTVAVAEGESLKAIREISNIITGCQQITETASEARAEIASMPPALGEPT